MQHPNHVAPGDGLDFFQTIHVGLVTNSEANGYVRERTGLNPNAWLDGAYWTSYGDDDRYLERESIPLCAAACSNSLRFGAEPSKPFPMRAVEVTSEGVRDEFAKPNILLFDQTARE
ncbi:hypothetical protein [Collimonas arenae]|uniref:hypothetical protein n=1 Tax=Collimonas arenae TaxID=279058 RepID=UPI0007785BC9|nr:hypothetical protein [Collimonas arenae]